MSSSFVGFIYIVLFFGSWVALVMWLNRKYGARIRERQRERQMESAMLLGMSDAERYQRVAERIVVRQLMARKPRAPKPARSSDPREWVGNPSATKALTRRGA